MRGSAGQGFLAGLPPTGPATKYICIAIAAVSVLAAVAQRTFGIGTRELQFQVGPILDLQLWRLVTYPFVVSQPLGLLLGLLVFWLLGRSFEYRWGSRDFLVFFVSSSLGAGIIALPLYFVLNALGLFQEIGIGEGPFAVIDALFVALAAASPNANVLLGFVFPIRAKTLVYCIIGFDVLTGLMTGAAALSITLGGLAMGYGLVTGLWRPQRLFDRLRRVKTPPSRRSLYVVPPRDETLH